MICKYCNGDGVIVDVKRAGKYICPNCDGTGVVEPMTNEEWFCQLPTTEKSEFLSTMVKEAIEVHEKHGTTWHEAVSWWDGWFKAKHE